MARCLTDRCRKRRQAKKVRKSERRSRGAWSVSRSPFDDRTWKRSKKRGRKSRRRRRSSGGLGCGCGII